MIASCGSGVTAVVVILALTSLGVNNVALYDGSWGEWGSRNDLPTINDALSAKNSLLAGMSLAGSGNRTIFNR